MASMLAIGIFNDNVTMYEEAITYFKSGVGNGISTEQSGSCTPLTGEVSDKVRSGSRSRPRNADFALLGPLAQMAYNQGDDVFAYESNKILAGSEYCANIMWVTMSHTRPIRTVMSLNQ